MHNNAVRRRPGRTIFSMIINIPGKGQREYSTGQTDYDEALKVYQRKVAEIADGLQPSRGASAFTLAVALAMLLADYELNDRDTVANVRSRAKHLIRYFGRGRKLSTIDAGAWTLYQRARKAAGASNASINREQAALHRMFVLGHHARLVAAVPHLAKLKENNRRTGFFERPDYLRVKRHLPLDCRPIFAVMYLTGWRLEEVTRLEWRHVHADGWLRLDPADSKEESGKGIPYAQLPALARVLRTCARVRDELHTEGLTPSRVFVRWTGGAGARRGDPITSWRGAFLAAREAAGVPGKLLHDLRRTAARNLNRAGVSTAAVMAIMGHKTLSMWQRYNIQTEADVQAELGRVTGHDERRASKQGLAVVSRGGRRV
jgi:integrase